MGDEANITIYITIVVEFDLKCSSKRKNPKSIDWYLPRLPKSICRALKHVF